MFIRQERLYYRVFMGRNNYSCTYISEIKPQNQFEFIFRKHLRQISCRNRRLTGLQAHPGLPWQFLKPMPLLNEPFAKSDFHFA